MRFRGERPSRSRHGIVGPIRACVIFLAFVGFTSLAGAVGAGNRAENPDAVARSVADQIGIDLERIQANVVRSVREVMAMSAAMDEARLRGILDREERVLALLWVDGRGSASSAVAVRPDVHVDAISSFIPHVSEHRACRPFPGSSGGHVNRHDGRLVLCMPVFSHDQSAIYGTAVAIFDLEGRLSEAPASVADHELEIRAGGVIVLGKEGRRAAVDQQMLGMARVADYDVLVHAWPLAPELSNPADAAAR